jgi:hypothetical protein
MSNNDLNAWATAGKPATAAAPNKPRTLLKAGGATIAGLLIVGTFGAVAVANGSANAANTTVDSRNDIPQASDLAGGAVADSAFGVPSELLPSVDPLQAGVGDGIPTDAVAPPAPQPLPTAKTQAVSLKTTKDLVGKYFPAKQAGNAVAVARGESGLTNATGAVNTDTTIDWGLFQLNDGGTLQNALDGIGVDYTNVRQAQKLALNPDVNVRAAAWIWRSRGWAPWVAAYKIGVVDGLYSNAKGPNYGKYNLNGILKAEKPKKEKPKKEKPKKPAVVKPAPPKPTQPTKTPKPVTRPTPPATPTPTAKPTTTPTPTSSPTTND